jgi:hypothetical protein
VLIKSARVLHVERRPTGAIHLRSAQSARGDHRRKSRVSIRRRRDHGETLTDIARSYNVKVTDGGKL